MTRILDKQNIFDLLLQESGGLNNTARVLRDNGLNFNDSMVSGNTIGVGVLESEKIKENYKLIRFKPNNSELTGPIEGEWILEQGSWNGVGVWTSDGIWKTV